MLILWCNGLGLYVDREPNEGINYKAKFSSKDLVLSIMIAGFI